MVQVCSFHQNGQHIANMLKLLKSALAAGVLLTSTAYGVSPVKVDGADFVNAVSGTRFQIIGVAYDGYDVQHKTTH